MKKLTLLLAAIAFALPAGAALTDVSRAGFLVTHSAAIQATPARTFAAFSQVGRWWDSEHTYSGNAASLSMQVTAGGCFCERWNQNSIEHGRVIQVVHDKALRLEASLGPLQEMAVTGILHFGIEPAGDGTRLSMTYRVRGAPEASLDKVAAAVDRVMGVQLARLARFVETGAPAAAAAPEPPRDRFFRSGDLALRYLDEGEGVDAVVLVHDLGADVESQWIATGVLPMLARQQIFRVVALDLRGHGKSGRGEAASRESAGDIVRLLDHLRIRRAHLVGYGLGAQAAAWVAANHPERLLTLTLAGAAPARRGELALDDGELARIAAPTLAIVAQGDPAMGEVLALRRVMPRLWRSTVIGDENHATLPRSDEFITALQYFLRYHPGRLVPQ